MSSHGWIYDDVFDLPRRGLYQQEFITYEEKDGVLRKTVVIRKFFGDNDYQDSITSSSICEIR
tara:strand:- start:741 stop:929 length:189 start_codon:yes stop_codon:yes gene_type:complete